MSIYIEIKKCSECPHIDHKGAYAKVAYVPLCREARKTIPYTVIGENNFYAEALTEIPEWCPLPKSEKNNETR